jgi:succinate-semialdehyde dehydrogenase/glutarate-semialdehyde dehydrogenase
MTPELNHPDLLRTQAFINGKWCPAGDGATLAVTNPATGDVVAEVARVGERETEQAITAAETAMVSWRHTPAKQRAQILR